jgi:hypothetical protein
VAELEQSIRTWIDTWNDDPKPFVWTKIADQILDSIPTYCQRINASGHEAVLSVVMATDAYGLRSGVGPSFTGRSAAEQGLQLGEHHLPRLAAQVGSSGRVRALAHHQPGPPVVVVELHS